VRLGSCRIDNPAPNIEESHVSAMIAQGIRAGLEGGSSAELSHCREPGRRLARRATRRTRAESSQQYRVTPPRFPRCPHSREAGFHRPWTELGPRRSTSTTTPFAAGCAERACISKCAGA
jgi:hypothetical protein